MTDKNIQDQLDAQIKAKRAAQVVEVSEAPTLTSEIFERDDRREAIVEVNFRDMSARLVETSDAPKLTTEVLQTLGKPLKTVEMFFDNQIWQVTVRDGVPLELEIQQLKIIKEYADREHDPTVMAECDRAIANLMLAHMIVDPQFSYQGEGEDPPIEARSSVLIDALSNAQVAVNNLTEDEIYQVTVRRGIPSDAFAIAGETFEFYSVGGKRRSYVEMPDEELSVEMARNTARRQVLVPAMIVDPHLSYTPVSEDVEVSGGDTEGYPVGLLSERFMRTLMEAHKVTNIPEAGLRSLQHHFRSRNRDTNGTQESRKSLGDDGGTG